MVGGLCLGMLASDRQSLICLFIGEYGIYLVSLYGSKSHSPSISISVCMRVHLDLLRHNNKINIEKIENKTTTITRQADRQPFTERRPFTSLSLTRHRCPPRCTAALSGPVPDSFRIAVQTAAAACGGGQVPSMQLADNPTRDGTPWPRSSPCCSFAAGHCPSPFWGRMRLSVPGSRPPGPSPS